MEHLIGLFDPTIDDSPNTFDEDFDLDELDLNNNFDDLESSLNVLPSILPPEEYYGSIEYKRQLIDPTESRITHLTTQMQFRLTEGAGECRYMIGVDDDGSFHGLGKNMFKFG
jgi:hypothetical protein